MGVNRDTGTGPKRRSAGRIQPRRSHSRRDRQCLSWLGSHRKSRWSALPDHRPRILQPVTQSAWRWRHAAYPL